MVKFLLSYISIPFDVAQAEYVPSGGRADRRQQSPVLKSRLEKTLETVAGDGYKNFVAFDPYQEASRPAAKPEWIPVDKIVPGPICNPILSETQIQRAERLRDIFQEVFPSTVEEWLDSFKRDQRANSELSLWEHMGAVYNRYCAYGAPTLQEKKDAFSVILARSMMPNDEILSHRQELNLLKTPLEQIHEILALYDQVALERQ